MRWRIERNDHQGIGERIDADTKSAAFAYRCLQSRWLFTFLRFLNTKTANLSPGSPAELACRVNTETAFCFSQKQSGSWMSLRASLSTTARLVVYQQVFPEVAAMRTGKRVIPER